MIAFMILGIGMVYFGMPLAVGNLGFNIYLAVVLRFSIKHPFFIALFILLIVVL